MMCLALGGAWVLGSRAEQQADQELRTELTRVAGNRAEELTRTLRQLRSETLLLMDMPPVQGIVRASQHKGVDPLDGSTLEAWHKRLQHIFSAYAASNPLVSQLRLIGVDHQGLELVRVERDGDRIRVVAAEDLQAKGDRSYLQRGLQIPAGSVWVDGPSLNREHGVIETPHRAMLRLVSPVRGDDDRTFGAIVVNIDAALWMNSALSNLPAGFEIFLSTGAGDFVVHPDLGKTYGFDLGRPHRWRDEFALLAGSSRADDEVRVQRWQRLQDASEHWIATERVMLSPELGDSGLLELSIAASTALMDAARQRSRAESLKLALLMLSLAGAGVLLFQRGERRLRDLRFAQARLAAIIESSQDAIIGESLDGIVTSWNRGAERLFGWQSNDMLGQSTARLLPPELAEQEDKILASMRAGNAIENLKTERLHKDGRRLTVLMTLSPVRDAEGRVVAAARIVRIEAHALREVAAMSGYPRPQSADAELEARSAAPEANALRLQHACEALSPPIEAPIDASTRLLGELRGPALPSRGLATGEASGSPWDALQACIDSLSEGRLDALKPLRRLCQAQAHTPGWSALIPLAEALDIEALRRAAAELQGSTNSKGDTPR
ncbi:PAS domain-containing protein [Aquimonas voraii]|nr:PAS domain S-box protein [Aquimonas voraii]